MTTPKPEVDVHNISKTWLWFYFIFDIYSIQGISEFSYTVRKHHLFDLYTKTRRLFRLAMLGGSITLRLVPGSLVPEGRVPGAIIRILDSA